MNTTTSVNPPGATLDTAQAAALLKVEPNTLRAWRRRRVGLPYVRVAHNTVRYLPRQLEEWMAANTITPGSPPPQRD